MVRSGLELLLGGLLVSCVQPVSNDDSQGYTPLDDDSALYDDDDTIPVDDDSIDDDDYTPGDDDTVGDDDVGDDDTTGNLPPIAEAGEDRYGNIGETIEFYFDQSGTGSYDKDGQIVFYRALWGDNVENYGPSGHMGHVYPNVGEYTLTLIVQDDEGATSSDTTLVTVY